MNKINKYSTILFFGAIILFFLGCEREFTGKITFDDVRVNCGSSIDGWLFQCSTPSPLKHVAIDLLSETGDFAPRRIYTDEEGNFSTTWESDFPEDLITILITLTDSRHNFQILSPSEEEYFIGCALSFQQR